MRGKLHINGKNRFSARITPADAGKTVCPVDPAAILEDHPRGCGENFGKISLVFHVVGSPPRMRGKPKGCIEYQRVERITPADAGKTISSVIPVRRTTSALSGESRLTSV